MQESVGGLTGLLLTLRRVFESPAAPIFYMKYYESPNGAGIAVHDEPFQILGAALFNCYYGVSGEFYFTDTVSDTYLRDVCKEISEEDARKRHPRLIEFIEKHVEAKKVLAVKRPAFVPFSKLPC